MFAEDEARIIGEAALDPDDHERLLAARIAGEPLEPLVGWAGFCGRRVLVDPGVFVPRQRTGLLVREAIALAPPRAIVVDLCCGTGAVALAVSAEIPGATVLAADLDAAAVRNARRNLPDAEVREGDLYAALPDRLRGRIDVLLVNAPYVPTGSIRLMPPEARLYEPVLALDGGHDGTAVQRRVAAEAASWLAPGGALLIEVARDQAAAVAAALVAGRLSARIVRDDALDATAVIGRRCSGSADPHR